MKTTFPKINEGDFYEVINEAKEKGRHVDYLEKVLKDYGEYKTFFEVVFSDKNSPNDVYFFKVNYLLKKLVWREIAILGRQTFRDLAEAIIYSMDWENDHMHGFNLPKDHKQKNWDFFESRFTFYAPGWEDDPHPTYKSDEIKICQFNFDLYPKLMFLFDFGDGHEFEVTLEKVESPSKTKSQKDFPVLIDMRGVAPEQYPNYEDLDREN